MREQKIDTLNYLASNEELIGRLYITYANRFPEQHQFWQDLADEENKHASWIRQLQSKAEEGRLYIKTDRFNVVTIINQMKHIDDEIKRASKPETSLINALSFALNLEHSLLEQKYFDVFDTDSAELKKLLSGLAEDTKRHATKVKELWEENNKLRH